MLNIAKIIEHQWFERVVIFAIAVNAALLGLETLPGVMNRWGDILLTIDFIFIAFFTLEIVLRIAVQKVGFFSNGWNLFDFAIVAITLMPFFGNLSVLRAFRILRALRILSVIPAFRSVIQGFFASLTGLLSVSAVLFLVIYISSVLAVKLFGSAFPTYFGDLFVALFTLFQILTLESWGAIVRDVMTVYPYAWIFFLPYIMVTAFAVFNLLIGIIVNSMQRAHEEESKETIAAVERVTTEEYKALEAKIDKLRDEIRTLIK